MNHDLIYDLVNAGNAAPSLPRDDARRARSRDRERNGLAARPRRSKAPSSGPGSTAAALIVVMFGLVACAGDDGGGGTAETEAEQEPNVVSLPQIETLEAEPIDWTAPTGTTYEDALHAYDEARESKIGEHPGYRFAGDIWERLAADNHAPSQYHLGLLYYLGNGGREFNHNKTGDLVRASADQGYAVASAFMAMMNESGDGALFLKDDTIALKNWQKAAAGGHCGAIKRLKHAYENGELGLSKDSTEVDALDAALPSCSSR